MIRIAMLAAATMAFACAAQPSGETGNASPPAAEAPMPQNAEEATARDTCGAARFQYLVGQPESAIPRDRLPAGSRVICATCMVTQDFSPQRLNITLSADGKVASLGCY